MNKITKKHLKEKETEIVSILIDNPKEVKKIQTGRMSFEFEINGDIVMSYNIEQNWPIGIKHSYNIIDENIDTLINFLESKKFNF